MSETAEQLVLEYLARAAEAAHGTLRSAERLAFVARLRTHIEQQRAKADAATPEQIRKLLDGLGDPARLVARERQRLDGGSGETESSSPEQRPAPRRGRRTVGLRMTGQGLSRPRPARRTGGGAQSAPSRQVTMVGWGRPPGQQYARGAGSTMLRRRDVELGAAGLLGIGGLLLPVPLWLLGAVLVVLTRKWGRADLIIGLAMPVVVAAGGGVAQHEPGAKLWETVTGPGLMFFRFAALICALYLVIRLFLGTRKG